MNSSNVPLEYLHLSNKTAEAKIALQGAHILHFQVKGQKPLLWLSDTAVFEKGKAIRGGIPVCWPWFGTNKEDSTLPNHGFARTAIWEHIATETISETQTKAILRLKSSSETLLLWPFAFELTLEVTIGPELRVCLVTKNLDTKAFTITDALHTYLAIDDIHSVYVDGLDNKNYYDKALARFNNVQEGRLYFNQEIDRVYQGITASVDVHDKDRCIKVQTEGSQTVVIWNPAEALAAKFSDLSDYSRMLCIESANALDDAPRIQPGETHRLTSILSQA